MCLWRCVRGLCAFRQGGGYNAASEPHFIPQPLKYKYTLKSNAARDSSTSDERLVTVLFATTHFFCYNALCVTQRDTVLVCCKGMEEFTPGVCFIVTLL